MHGGPDNENRPFDQSIDGIEALIKKMPKTFQRLLDALMALAL